MNYLLSLADEAVAQLLWYVVASIMFVALYCYFGIVYCSQGCKGRWIS